MGGIGRLKDPIILPEVPRIVQSGSGVKLDEWAVLEYGVESKKSALHELETKKHGN